jgi:hypothetical protein
VVTGVEVLDPDANLRGVMDDGTTPFMHCPISLDRLWDYQRSCSHFRLNGSVSANGPGYYRSSGWQPGDGRRYYSFSLSICLIGVVWLGGWRNHAGTH